MTKKVIDLFRGELYMANADIVAECIKNNSKPFEEFFELKRISLIEDQENSSKYLIGDFEGDVTYYGFTLKIFLYENGKALGNSKYVPGAKMASSTVDAKFINLSHDGFMIHGFFLTEGKPGKEFFILFVEKPGKANTLSPLIIEEEKTSLRNKILFKKQITPQKLPNKSIKNKTSVKADGSNDTNDISIIRNFIKLKPKANKDSCVHFLAYLLVKVGFTVQTYHSGPAFPELLIEKNGKCLYVHVNVSNRRKPEWKLLSTKVEIHFYIFCHVISNETFPDVYIFKSAKLNSLIRKKDKISIVDKEMAMIKNSWAPLLD